MRSAGRLDSFYYKMKCIHKETFQDLRFGQLMCNFFGWLSTTKGIDPFFPEEDKMIMLLEEYAKEAIVWNGD